MPPFVIGALRDLRSVTGFCGFSEVCLDAASGKNAACFVQHGAAAMPAVPGVGVVNQQRVLDFRGHTLFASCARVIEASRLLPSLFYIMSREIELSLLQRVSWPKLRLLPSRKRSSNFARSF